MLFGAKPLLATCLLVFTASTSMASDLTTADAVIAKYIDAIGGRAKLDAVKTVRLNGKLTMQGGMEMPMTMEVKLPNKVRVEAIFQGMAMTQGYDGESGWMIAPFTGSSDAQKMPEEQVKQFKNQADVHGPLVDYKKKGHTVELDGAEEVEGTATYKLKVTKKDGDVEFYLVDKKRFLPVAMRTRAYTMAGESDAQVIFGDYKEVNGVMMAHNITQKAAMSPENSMIFEKIEVNVDIPDSRFAMPKSGTGDPSKD